MSYLVKGLCREERKRQDEGIAGPWKGSCKDRNMEEPLGEPQAAPMAGAQDASGEHRMRDATSALSKSNGGISLGEDLKKIC